MSTTLDTLTTDLTTAMKARDTFRTSVLRQVIGAIRAEEKAGKVARTLTEDDVLAVLASQAKLRRDTAQNWTDNGVHDRAATENAEADVIDAYLPAKLTAAELDAIVAESIAAVGATTMKQMGQVMKEATARAGLGADGKTLSALVRAALA